MSGQFKDFREAILRSKGPKFLAQLEAAYLEVKRQEERGRLMPEPDAPAPQTDRGEG